MWFVRASPIRGAAILGLVFLVLAGCGGMGIRARAPATSSLPGAKVFDNAGCGGCHTLQAAKSKGTVGPDLDQLRPDAQRVARQVKNGGVGMPSFAKKLSEVEISQVAEFVSESTRASTMGGSVAARLQARRHEDRGLRGDRLPLLRAGVREHLVQGQPEDGPRSVRQGHQDARADRARLPPDRPRDRRRSALTLTTATSARRSSPAGRAAPPATTTASSSGPSSESTRASSAPRRGSSARAPRSASPSSSPTSACTGSGMG